MSKIAFVPRDGDRFMALLRQRAAALLADPVERRRGRRLLLAKAGVFGGMGVLSYGALLASGGAPLAALAAAVAFAMSVLFLAVNIGHDAAHETLVRRRGLNHAIQFACFSLMGVDAYLWRFRHVVSHHVFPNVNGSDIDIDRNPFLRLSPNQPWRPRFRHQHLYAPLVYCFVALHSIWVQDYAYLFKRELANAKGIRHPWPRFVEFAAGKLVHVTVALAIPMLVLPLAWWQVAIGYVAALGVMSLLFVIALVGTHFSTQAAFPEPDAAGRIRHGFAEHALVTSVDWEPQSRLAGFFAGGANTHAAHHLFPRVAHVHYRRLSGLIAEVAARCQAPYHRTSLAGMVADHLRFLRQMGRRPQAGCAARPPTLRIAR